MVASTTKTQAPRRVWDFAAEGVNDYYPRVIETLMEQGTEAAPRGKRTRELHPTTVLLQDPRKRLLTAHGRMINVPFALAEIVQIITGTNDAQALAWYNSGIIAIQGDGPRGTPHWELGVTRFNAAYGERLRQYNVGQTKMDQLEHVIKTLRKDPDSRQASIVLSHPMFDNYEVQTVDRACNVYAHAMIRDGAVDWMQIIRSNDAIWGIPYNMMQWCHLHEWVAAELQRHTGTMFIVQDSFHVYEDKYDEARKIEPFDLYQYIDVLPMSASDGIAEDLLFAERNIRAGMEYGPDKMKQLEQRVGPYWCAVIACFQSYRAFKKIHDDKAFELLPQYAELRLPMLRNYCQWRWNKMSKIFADLRHAAFLEVSMVGVPHEEVEKWLGPKQILS